MFPYQYDLYVEMVDAPYLAIEDKLAGLQHYLCTFDDDEQTIIFNPSIIIFEPFSNMVYTIDMPLLPIDYVNID